MHPIPHCSLASTLLAFLFLLFALIQVPTALCADDPRYTNCSTTITCGSIADISYPFWGINRPSYCGQPGFELKCEDEVAKLDMIENTLRVLDVNPNQQILKVAREDYWDGYCPSKLVNTTINFTDFDYVLPSLRNLTLFYGCNTPPTFLTNCTIDGVPMDVSYAITNLPGDLRPVFCLANVVVPVYERVAENLETNPSTVMDALRGGFELHWEEDSDQCRRCTDSDGVCGYNQTTSGFICFCRNQTSETVCPSLTQGTLISSSTIILVSCLICLLLP